MAAKRVDPKQARHDIASGNALLVCAYDDQEKSQKYQPWDAISLAEFKAREAELSKDREIVFYCA